MSRILGPPARRRRTRISWKTVEMAPTWTVMRSKFRARTGLRKMPLRWTRRRRWMSRAIWGRRPLGSTTFWIWAAGSESLRRVSNTPNPTAEAVSRVRDVIPSWSGPSPKVTTMSGSSPSSCRSLQVMPRRRRTWSGVSKYVSRIMVMWGGPARIPRGRSSEARRTRSSGEGTKRLSSVSRIMGGCPHQGSTRSGVPGPLALRRPTPKIRWARRPRLRSGGGHDVAGSGPPGAGRRW